MLLLLLFPLIVHSLECPEIYRRFSKEHSYCRAANVTCGITTTSLGEKELTQVLELHNAFRSVVAMQQQKASLLPSAADMLEMEWDKELAAVAQMYANQCIFAHDCPNCRRVRNFGVGQNIAIQTVTGDSQPYPDWSFAVGEWFAEIVAFDKEMVCPFRPPTRGENRHFTQMIWSSTFRVGCGYTVYKQMNTWTRLYICNYGPAGNTYDTCVYKQGAPCSQCPVNTCCGDSCHVGTYPGLCKRIDEKPPIIFYKALPSSTLFDCDFQNPSKQDCLINSSGDGKWFIVSTLEGNFLEIVLNSGQSNTLEFTKSIQPISKVFCVKLIYRKGPTVDGNLENNFAQEVLLIPTMNEYTFTQPLPSYPATSLHQFSTYNLTLQWEAETIVKISFSVPPGANAQFLNLYSLQVFDNACDN